MRPESEPDAAVEGGAAPGGETQTERLILLQDLLELRREWLESGELDAMQELGFALPDRAAALAEIESAVTAMRARVRPDLLRRFERVAAKYRRPLAPLRGGTCYGCFTRFPTGRFETLDPDRPLSCPNCGRIVYPI